MRQETSTAILIVTLLLVAFSLRFGAACWWQARLPDEQSFAFGDSFSYWILAQNICRGEPYEYGGRGTLVFRTPGYPLLLAGLFSVTGDDPPVLWARGLGATLGTLAVGGIMWLAWELFDVPTAILAGAIATVYPGAIGMSVFVLSEAPFCPLFVAQLLCWIVAIRSPSWPRVLGWSAVAGLAAGCATLVRPSWLPFTPLVALLALAICRDRRRHAGIGLVMCLALGMTMLPWWARNYRVTGHFVPTTLQVGASLYDGLNPQATGASNMEFVAKFRHEQRLADASREGPLEDTFEYRLDQRMRAAAIHWAGRHPGQVLRLAGHKLLRMWSPWPNAAEMQSWLFCLATVLGYTPLLILGSWGAVRYGRRGWPYVLCLLPAAYFSLLHMVFVSSIRYRQPAVLSVIVLAAGVAGAQLWGDQRARENSVSNDQ